jgi:hypothetical protein
MKKYTYPYSYYAQKFYDEKAAKCPFCNEDIIYTSENKDIVFCQQYGGYITVHACESYRDPADGDCGNCRPSDEKAGKFEFVTDDGFLCENCHHGVIFSKKPVFFTELFLHDDKKECKHCKTHNERVEREEKREASMPDDLSKFL